MSKRDVFVNYVKNGGGKFCSPQIGAGAGFDTKIAGKEWISETTLEDTINAVGMFDIVPLINVGCPFEQCSGKSVWQVTYEENNGEKITRESQLKTPVGILNRKTVEEKRAGAFQVKYPMTAEEDLDSFEYYLDELIESEFDSVTDFTAATAEKINGRAALSVQWPVQPYELLCYPNTVDMVLLASDCPERVKRLMDKIVILDEKLMKAVSRGGADFIFLGAPASEMLSPGYYKEFIIPYSKIVTSIAHSNNLLVYSHICSPIEPFLTMGFYNEMGIDLFETLSPPPVGNVHSLKDALDKINPEICTRGNVGLDVLLKGSKSEIEETTYRILEAAQNRKHMVAASDYLFYDTPAENIDAMVNAVNCKKGVFL